MKTQLISIVMVLIMGVSAKAQSASTPDYIAAYLQLKDALHMSDVAKAKSAATGMKSKITAAKLDDQKKVESITTSLAAIADSDDIEAQRKAFSKVSQYMITLLHNDPISGLTLYSDFCPMALNGKGAYWLSMDKEVNHNPYMGEKMPHCGSVDETISK